MFGFNPENPVNPVSNSAPLRLRGEISGGSWLPDMDLNHDKQIQSLLCYRYTIGQCKAGVKVSPLHVQSSRPSRADFGIRNSDFGIL